MTKKAVPPFFAAPWEVADASALQALHRGEATPDQQTRALDWIMKSASARYAVPFFPGQADASAFMMGRQFVSSEIVKLLTVNPQAFIKDKAQ